MKPIAFICDLGRGLAAGEQAIRCAVDLGDLLGLEPQRLAVIGTKRLPERVHHPYV
jgi:hypothetical protein